MFQVSRRADYAVRIMIELAQSEADRPLTALFISGRSGVPKAFLHKITADLVKARLVRSLHGPGGGFLLAEPAAQISLYHILAAAEGPICLNVCLIRPAECPRDQICPAHGVWARLQDSMVRQLQAVRLDALAREARQLARQPRPPDRPELIHLTD